jgi:hypothetical protein
MPQTSMAKISMSGYQTTRMVTDRVRERLAKIDTLVANGELVPSNLIKMDVEGAEVFVVRGAMEVLRKWRPVVFAEIHSSALLSECSSLLGELGYVVSVIDKDIDAARHRDVF